MLQIEIYLQLPPIISCMDVSPYPHWLSSLWVQNVMVFRIVGEKRVEGRIFNNIQYCFHCWAKGDSVGSILTLDTMRIWNRYFHTPKLSPFKYHETASEDLESLLMMYLGAGQPVQGSCAFHEHSSKCKYLVHLPQKLFGSNAVGC